MDSTDTERVLVLVRRLLVIMRDESMPEGDAESAVSEIMIGLDQLIKRIDAKEMKQ